MYSRLCYAAICWMILNSSLNAADDYKLGPESQEQPGVPQGKIAQHSWKSKIFEGTDRDYWVYVPAQYDVKNPACVMVFQDGGSYVNKTGQFRVPIVFDNLIHKKHMPVTIGIFINPGKNPKEPAQRSVEYDTLSDVPLDRLQVLPKDYGMDFMK